MAENGNTPGGEGTKTQGAGGTAGTEARDDAITLTQEQLNKMLASERKRERAKFEGYEGYKADAEAHADYDDVVAERDRLAAEVARRDLAARVSEETGVPASLIQGVDEGAMRESAEALRAWAASGRPGHVTDRGGAASPAGPTDAEIEAIPNRMERIRARAAQIERRKAR